MNILNDNEYFQAPMKKDLRIAAIVCNCEVGNAACNVARTSEYCRLAAHNNADMVVFPEMDITGYSTRGAAQPIAADGPESQTIRSFARKFNLTILWGMAEAGKDGRVYASQAVVKPSGETDVYRKVHLNPVEQDVFSPGDAIKTFDLDGFCFGVQLCYDAHFPEISTAMALAGAHAIIIPHASPRGTPEDKEQSWMRTLPARAFDNGLYVIAVNQCGANKAGLEFPGLALALDPLGKIQEKRVGEEGMMIVDLDAERLNKIRSHKMMYFLPYRRPDIYI